MHYLHRGNPKAVCPVITKIVCRAVANSEYKKKSRRHWRYGEKVFEVKLRQTVHIREQPFGFMSRKNSSDASPALRALVEKNKGRQKELHWVCEESYRTGGGQEWQMNIWGWCRRGVKTERVLRVEICCMVVVQSHSGSALSSLYFLMLFDTNIYTNFFFRQQH